MKFLLENKVIIVIGGLGLIGKSIVRSVLECSAACVIADTNKEEAQFFLQSLQSDYPQGAIDFVETDICSKNSLTKMIAYATNKYEKIDGVINSSYPRSKNYGKLFEEVEYDDFCQNVSMHLGGYFLATQQLVICLKKQGYGSIVNLASIYGVIAPRFEIYENSQMTSPVEYAAIKSGIIHLTKYIAKYLKGTGVRINTVSPGGIYDNQNESFVRNYNKFSLSKGMLDPADVVGTLIYLISDASIYVNGQNIIVDDGWSL